MNDEAALVLLESIRQEFIKIKNLGEDAFYQLRERTYYTDPFWQEFGREQESSIGLLMQHVIGNLRSRFTDFFTTDGEKPWRDRDKEFVKQYLTNEELNEKWHAAWMILFTVIAEIEANPKLLFNTIHIRKEPIPVIDAFLRQMTHYSYHAGQIVFIAKEIMGSQWQTLSIPLGKSAEYLNKVPPPKERK
jgi:hypothetical protein